MASSPIFSMELGMPSGPTDLLLPIVFSKTLDPHVADYIWQGLRNNGTKQPIPILMSGDREAYSSLTIH